MRLAPVTPDTDLLEKDLEAIVIGTKTNPGIARATGWRCYHVLRSKGSEAGWPDWVCVRERVLYMEMKTARGVVSPAQKEWLRALLAANAEAYIIRPRHIDQIAVVLQARLRGGVMVNAAALEAMLALRNQTRDEVGEVTPAA